MSISFYVAITILLLIVVWHMRRHGWVSIWNGFFLFVLILVLVIAQKHIGKIEGLLIVVDPFVAGKMLISKNRKVNIFYFARQSKFINWCHTNIYHLVYTENYPQEKSVRAKRRKKNQGRGK